MKKVWTHIIILIGFLSALIFNIDNKSSDVLSCKCSYDVYNHYNICQSDEDSHYELKNNYKDIYLPPQTTYTVRIDSPQTTRKFKYPQLGSNISVNYFHHTSIFRLESDIYNLSPSLGVDYYIFALNKIII